MDNTDCLSCSFKDLYIKELERKLSAVREGYDKSCKHVKQLIEEKQNRKNT